MDSLQTTDSGADHRPRGLKEFLGYANQLPLSELEKATHAGWTGRLMLCGPRQSGLTTALKIVARDANGLAVIPKDFDVPCEIPWTYPLPGIRYFQGRRSTLYCDCSNATVDDIGQALRQHCHVGGDCLVLVDDLGFCTDKEEMLEILEAIESHSKAVVIAVNKENPEDQFQQAVEMAKSAGYLILPLAHPEPWEVHSYFDDIIHSDEVYVDEDVVHALSSAVDGKLSELLWYLGNGGYLNPEDFCSKMG